MKQLIFLTILVLASVFWLKAEENDEVIWEVDVESGLGELILSPIGDTFFNTKDSIVQIRNVENGALIYEIDVNDFNEDIKSLSISDNGRYLALSGDTPYVIIFDLFEKREINRLTTVVYERQEGDKFVTYNTDKWVSSSISPDGTKLLGVAKNKDVYSKTNLVVIEIESGEILFEERRISYDTFNPSDNSPEWEFANYSPDGLRIIAQLEYKTSEKSSPDSLYIISDNSFEIDSILENSFNKKLIAFSEDSEYLSYLSGNSIRIYNMNKRSNLDANFPSGAFGIVFSRVSTDIIYGFGFTNQIFNFINNEAKYIYNFPIVPKLITLDNKRVIGNLYSKIYCLKTFFSTTNIERIEDSINLLSPNPTTGEFRIELNNLIPSDFVYELISLSGQVAKSNSLGFIGINSDEITINISEVSNGQYTLRVYSNQEEFIFNVIKEG